MTCLYIGGGGEVTLWIEHQEMDERDIIHYGNTEDKDRSHENNYNFGGCICK